MSQLNIKVKNAPAAVSRIALLNLYPNYRVDIDGDAHVCGTRKASVDIGYDPSRGEFPYYYYVAPMNFMSTSATILRVYLSNGRSETFTAPTTGYFDANKAYYWSLDLAGSRSAGIRCAEMVKEGWR